MRRGERLLQYRRRGFACVEEHAEKGINEHENKGVNTSHQLVNEANHGGNRIQEAHPVVRRHPGNEQGQRPDDGRAIGKPAPRDLDGDIHPGLPPGGYQGGVPGEAEQDNAEDKVHDNSRNAAVGGDGLGGRDGNLARDARQHHHEHAHGQETAHDQVTHRGQGGSFRKSPGGSGRCRRDC